MAIALRVLPLLFAGRVAGQILVLLCAPTWLPRFELWQSGLLPYPLLLVAQILILALQARVVRAESTGRLVSSRPLAHGLRAFAALYFTAMLVRLPLTRWLAPESPLGTGVLPTVFHLVLAVWVAVVAEHVDEDRRHERNLACPTS